MPSYDAWKLDTPERYEIDGEDGEPIPHDPDEDDFDHEGDTAIEDEEGEEREYDFDVGNPVGCDPMSDEEAAFWHEQNRLSHEQSVRTQAKGSY